MSITKNINFRLIGPIVVLWVFIFVFLYVFVLHSISDFAGRHIQQNMRWLANGVYTICDNNLDAAIRTGTAADPRHLKIGKVRTLRQVEDYLRQNDVLGFVYLNDADEEVVIWKSPSLRDVDGLIREVSEYGQVIEIESDGEEFSAYRLSFDPWGWHIVLMQSTDRYGALVERVTTTYTATAGILVTSLLLIVYLFHAVIRKPINQIIAPLKENRTPRYRGTAEIEFLSKNVEEMLESLHRAKEELEQRVKERTNELKLAMEDAEAAKEEAEAANAAKSEFLARMSHEMRTPLNAVTGLANIVLKSELGDEQREYLAKVVIASRSLLEVINDVLDFSKIEAGRLELSEEPFDLGLLLEQVGEMFSDRIADKDLELILAVALDAPRHLTGDAVRLTRVLTNLVDNAVKFTDVGEIVVRVEARGEREARGESQLESQREQELVFVVSDTGAGIAADELPRLFDPFTQIEGYLTRRHEGSGLGLAICRRLVELMGGRIWAESTVGEGSTFSFSVSLQVRQTEERRLHAPADLRGLKSLVVDDNAAVRQLLRDMLDSFSFEVTAVESGTRAIEELRRAKEPYQLVLLDWRMPGRDGLEIATAIRGDARIETPRIVILATAYGREHVRRHIDGALVDAMLLKPIKASQAFNTIMELFGHREAAVPRRPQEPRALPIQALSGRRVLVVEDADLNREVVSVLLREAGMVVDVAENGRIAVDKVTGSPTGYYGAVLMDIQMPIMDGYEATRRIRTFEEHRAAQATQPIEDPQTPIIALTAHALKGEKEKCLAAGMDDYLSKPLDELALHRVLLKWIGTDSA